MGASGGVEKCINCQFYDRRHAKPLDGKAPLWGQCRRHSPRLNPITAKTHVVEGVWPLVRDDDVVVFACRDAAARQRRGCQPLPENMLVIDRDQVRHLGAGAAAGEAVRYLTRAGGPQDGFWIHLDADVFDETIMQAVDDPRPDGLAWSDVISALSVAVRSGRATGLQVAIYNPDIDADGSNGRGLAATVREALSAPAEA